MYYIRKYIIHTFKTVSPRVLPRLENCQNPFGAVCTIAAGGAAAGLAFFGLTAKKTKGMDILFKDGYI